MCRIINSIIPRNYLLNLFTWCYHNEVSIRIKSILSEDDKMTVARARKVQRFLSQPFHVAEAFTGLKGVLVPIEETIRGFNMIMDGEVDGYPEAAFNLVGSIDDAIAKGKKLIEQAKN